jgi:muramoyltetrapeptide carboxypeptidase
LSQGETRPVHRARDVDADTTGPVVALRGGNVQLVIAPPPLRPRDRIAVVAPSSPFGRENFFRGLGWLRGRYEIVAKTEILTREGYLAGGDARRLAELSSAMGRDDVKAIVCARGGYGATRIVEELPWDVFLGKPKWIVGFSDVTALHCAASARGVMSVHGPHVTGLHKTDPMERMAFMRALERPQDAFEWTGLRVLTPPSSSGVTGAAAGGNLALVHAMAAAGELVLPKGAVLFLEDITERPFRVDRMLTSLLHHLADVSAIVFGSFTECDPGPDGVTVDQVLAERTAKLGIPVLSGAPFGHGTRNEAFIVGRQVEVRGDSVRFL